MELDLVSTIKVELEEEVEAAEESDNNNTRLPEPLALVKPRPERDITERFPYIDEVELQTKVREDLTITEKPHTRS